jgi:hypothetical protein
MTWHTFFNFSTMEHRHLVWAYATVWTIQIGYLGWVVRGWLRTKDPRN